MGNEAHGQWGHMGDGVYWHINARSRSQNLRLPYIFLISEANS